MPTLDQPIDWIGTEPSSDFQLAEIAENGLETSVVKTLLHHGLSTAEVYSVVIPQRTLKHRRSRQERLSREESDRAIRAARILGKAQMLFGTEAAALEWMREPKQRFNGRTPFQLLVTEAGGRVIEQMLIQLDEGMFT